jgi:predicted metal-dependent peptidase
LDKRATSIFAPTIDVVPLYYNPDFDETLNSTTLSGVLALELLHPILHHQVRRSGRHPRRWNEACDYAINSPCSTTGLCLPEDILVCQLFAA